MNTIHSPRMLGALCLLLIFSPNLTGCGGSSGSGGSGSGSNSPSSTEYLFASGTTSVMSFSINPSSGVPTLISSVPGSNGASSIVTTQSGFVYAIDQQPAPTTNLGYQGIDGYSVNSAGALAALSGFPIVFSSSGGGYTFALDPVSPFLYDGPSGYAINSTTGAVSPISGYSGSSAVVAGAEMVFSPTGKFLYETDQNSSIIAAAIDPSTGIPSPVPGSPFEISANSQPFDIVMHPSGQFLYTALSYAGGVAAFAVNGTTGALTAVAGSPFFTTGPNNPQDYWLAMHPSGNFLYAFNLNGQTVSAFTINSTTGALTQIQGSPFQAQKLQPGGLVNDSLNGPMIVDPSGQYLYIATGESELAVFKINQTTGSISQLGASPVYVIPPPYAFGDSVTALAFGSVP